MKSPYWQLRWTPGKVPTKIEPPDFLYFDSDGWGRMQLARGKNPKDRGQTRHYASVRCTGVETRKQERTSRAKAIATATARPRGRVRPRLHLLGLRMVKTTFPEFCDEKKLRTLCGLLIGNTCRRWAAIGLPASIARAAPTLAPSLFLFPPARSTHNPCTWFLLNRARADLTFRFSLWRRPP